MLDQSTEIFLFRENMICVELIFYNCYLQPLSIDVSLIFLEFHKWASLFDFKIL